MQGFGSGGFGGGFGGSGFGGSGHGSHHGHHGSHHGSKHGHGSHSNSHGHGDSSPEKTSTGVFFDAQPTVIYKILSVMDGTKCFTVNQGGNHNLLLEDFKNQDNQKFHIYNQNGKYAFVGLFGNAALHVVGDSAQDGAVIKADPGQHQSSYV